MKKYIFIIGIVGLFFISSSFAAGVKSNGTQKTLERLDDSYQDILDEQDRLAIKLEDIECKGIKIKRDACEADYSSEWCVAFQDSVIALEEYYGVPYSSQCFQQEITQ